MINDEAIRLARAADLRSRVNEKLIKALIGLLAVKDGNLLEELCIIFDHARAQGGEIGRGRPEVWDGVERQINVLLELALGEDESEIDAEVRQGH